MLRIWPWFLILAVPAASTASVQVQAPRLAAAPGPRDEHGRGDVDRHARQRYAEYRPAGHRGRGHQAADRRVAEPDREQDQGDPVGLRRQDLGALEPVGVSARRRPRGQPRRDHYQRD